MPKTVIFSLENCKNCQTLGALLKASAENFPGGEGQRKKDRKLAQNIEK